ncbi:hypothetical protein KY290_005433 [Solanum tuberosum]|uniref:Protein DETOXIFICATION n=2 Tax=Solanum tuberosum TaxID=4113 RepID=A0ABQ7WE53_SOLTU|nr:PREDICTED: protein DETOXIFICATION 46, chloroplastic-like [Solanum tuberosum]KAH0723890.1 hypothetical protein KY289_006934 [Solanum tuberosum]KAH0779006.1 hypothetical protein KY290_005433 [Solanum tuberosum]
MSMCLQAINLNTFTHQSRTRIPVHNRTLVNVNSHLRISPIWNIRKGIITACSAPSQEILQQKLSDEDENSSSDAENSDSVENEQQVVVEFSANESIWNQTVEIIKFSGPAVGLWLSGPLMSLIDTAVVGQGSSIELAALGPGTVFCDNTSYIFMFLSIATSNLVATSLARQDKDQVQHQISILIFLGLVFGVLMFFCTRLFGIRALTSFTGAKNIEIINSANTYIQIRGLAWPALLVGWVAQSASLGMKDSWGPLKALAVATVINGIGDIVLCRVFSYGIAGAAWATMVSQVVAAYMMIEALNSKGYKGFAISIPSTDELLQIFTIAGPVFLTMMSKVAFYSLLVYFATSMGTQTIAAHQVMVQLFMICAVWGEPLSQTAQSFMPELLYGANRNLSKARMLLKSLVIVGASSGTILASVAASIPWLFPKVFSSDPQVIREMQKILLPYFIALFVTPSILSLEGTLLAGRDLKFISLSMSSIFVFSSILLMLLSSKGLGLSGCWFALVVFQWARFFMALRRLTLSNGILYSEEATQNELQKLKAA